MLMNLPDDYKNSAGLIHWQCPKCEGFEQHHDDKTGECLINESVKNVCHICRRGGDVYRLNGEDTKQFHHYQCYLYVLDNFVDQGLLTAAERSEKAARAYLKVRYEL